MNIFSVKVCVLPYSNSTSYNTSLLLNPFLFFQSLKVLLRVMFEFSSEEQIFFCFPSPYHSVSIQNVHLENQCKYEN